MFKTVISSDYSGYSGTRFVFTASYTLSK